MSLGGLSAAEEEELYVVLKPLEGTLKDPARDVLLRLEKALYARLTIEEMEKLQRRFAMER